MIMPTFEKIWITEQDIAATEYIEEMLKAALAFIYGERLDRVKKAYIKAAFGEALANACEHGNQNNIRKNVFVGLHFCELGLMISIRDEGDFFTKDGNKVAVDSRTKLRSTKKNPSGEGMSLIYKADRVVVSTGENTLYLVFII
jgi:anti-sigma regulatory factor (Ser/Thr protein kinase)